MNIHAAHVGQAALDSSLVRCGHRAAFRSICPAYGTDAKATLRAIDQHIEAYITRTRLTRAA